MPGRKQPPQSNRDRVAIALAKSGQRQPVVINIGDHIDHATEKYARQRLLGPLHR